MRTESVRRGSRPQQRAAKSPPPVTESITTAGFGCHFLCPSWGYSVGRLTLCTTADDAIKHPADNVLVNFLEIIILLCHIRRGDFWLSPAFSAPLSRLYRRQSFLMSMLHLPDHFLFVTLSIGKRFCQQYLNIVTAE